MIDRRVGDVVVAQGVDGQIPRIPQAGQREGLGPGDRVELAVRRRFPMPHGETAVALFQEIQAVIGDHQGGRLRDRYAGEFDRRVAVEHAQEIDPLLGRLGIDVKIVVLVDHHHPAALGHEEQGRAGRVWPPGREPRDEARRQGDIPADHVVAAERFLIGPIEERRVDEPPHPAVEMNQCIRRRHAPDGSAIGRGVVAAPRAAGAEAAEQLLRPERQVQVDSVGVLCVFEKLPIEDGDAVRPDRDIPHAWSTLVALDERPLLP